MDLISWWRIIDVISDFRVPIENPEITEQFIDMTLLEISLF